MEITEIKAHLKIDQVLNHYNLKPDKSQRLKCPWHNDKTPSLQIFPKTNSWTCFSSNCNAGSGDAIEFCVKMEGDKYKGILVAQSLVSPGSIVPVINQPPIQELPRIAVLSKVAQESQASFKRTAKAKDYLQSRGLDPEQTEAGYIGPELGKSWNETLQQSALQLGILNKSA
ncbi:MAG: CHC2 zinc finger domain-containing protein, partial [Bacteroidota bacterium]